MCLLTASPTTRVAPSPSGPPRPRREQPRRMTREARLFVRAISALRDATATLREADEDRRGAGDFLSRNAGGILYTTEFALAALESAAPWEVYELIAR
jgi:hypothetical protein